MRTAIRRKFRTDPGAVFTLRWNWSPVLLFVLIWSYGFENTGFSDAALKTVAVLVFLIWAIFLYSEVGTKRLDLYRDEVTLTHIDTLSFVSYLVLLSIAAFVLVYKLQIPLVGDQLFHAESSQSQAVALSNYLIGALPVSSSVEYRTLLRLADVGILGALVATYVYIRRSPMQDRTLLLVLLLLLLRLGAEYSDVHPPFRLFPLWLSSTFFGVNDFAFRFVSIAALALLAFLVYRCMTAQLGRLNAFLCGVAVSTIPLVFHVGSIAEQSIWTALLWSYVLITIADQKPLNYVRVISIISIVALMRAPAFVALVPVVTLMGVEYLRRRDYGRIGEYSLYLAPVMVLLPFLWIQLSQGTPATEGDSNALQRLAASLSGGFAFRVMYDNIQMPWVIFLPFCLLPGQGQWHKVIVILLFGCTAYYVFYSIRPVLWGLPRYQAELWLPFVILGFVNLVRALGRSHLKRAYLTIALTVLPLSNAATFAYLLSSNRPVDAWSDYFVEIKTGGVKVWSEGLYNIGDALQELKESGYSTSYCKVGFVHETFSEVLSGYSIAELASARETVPICSKLSLANLNKLDRGIKVILLVDHPDRDKQMSLLLNSGNWRPWMRFHNDVYGSTIIGLIRD